MGRFETAAFCDDCWDRRVPDKPAPRSSQGPLERCHGCGRLTTSGIYVRVDTESEPRAEPKDSGLLRVVQLERALAQLGWTYCGKHDVLYVRTDENVCPQCWRVE